MEDIFAAGKKSSNLQLYSCAHTPDLFPKSCSLIYTYGLILRKIELFMPM